jgi:ketol-acid reductoisomerase
MKQKLKCSPSELREELKGIILSLRKEIIDVLLEEGYTPNKIDSFGIHGIGWKNVVERMQELGIDFKPTPKGK